MIPATDPLRDHTPTDFIVEDNLHVSFVVEALDVTVD